jgi:hypothetical protein
MKDDVNNPTKHRHIFIKFGEDKCTYTIQGASYSRPCSPTEREQELVLEGETWKREMGRVGHGRERWGLGERDVEERHGEGGRETDTIDLPLNTSGIIEYDTVFN